MPRILGVDIPNDKPTHISLRYIKGIVRCELFDYFFAVFQMIFEFIDLPEGFLCCKDRLDDSRLICVVINGLRS